MDETGGEHGRDWRERTEEVTRRGRRRSREEDGGDRDERTEEVKSGGPGRLLDRRSCWWKVCSSQGGAMEARRRGKEMDRFSFGVRR